MQESYPGYLQRSRQDQIRHDALLHSFAVADELERRRQIDALVEHLFAEIAAKGIGWSHELTPSNGIVSQVLGE